MTTDLTLKVHQAKIRIENAHTRYGDKLFLGHSGGKDSQVILHLTKQVTDNFTIVHNVKPMYSNDMDSVATLTAMYDDTLDFLYSEIAGKHHVNFMPATMMEQFIKDTGLACQIDGARIVEAEREGKSANIIRNGENVSRADMTEFEPNGIFNLAISYPIFDWTEKDVFDYITANKIPLSAEYESNGELDAYRKGFLE